MESVPQAIEHFKRTSDNRMRLLTLRQIESVFIRVHSWLRKNPPQ